jgi:hypothetical protein
VFEAGYRAGQTGRDGDREHMDEVFFPAVKTHLLRLRQEGRLGTATGLAGRDVWAATDWNEMVVSGRFSRWLVHFLTNHAFHGSHVAAESGSVFDPGSRDPDIASEERVRRAWQNLCTLLDTGTTDHAFRLEGQQDGKTGDRCQLEFVDWKPVLTRWTGSGFEPAQDMGAIPLASVEIDCPSGELILTDAMTAGDDVFREAIDIGDRRYTVASLNSDQGSINYSTIVAAEYGFGAVSTDNTTVVVHRQGNRLVVSERWADEDLRLEDEDGDVTVAGWDKVGTFSCDRWMVEVMDRQVAADILTRNGMTDASAALDAWIAEEGDEVVTMKVTPGRYRIHFGPAFSERMDRAAAGIPSGPSPWLLMERIA